MGDDHNGYVISDILEIQHDLILSLNILCASGFVQAAEGKVCCGAIKDPFSKRIVGHAVSDRVTADPAIVALRTALARREPDRIVVVRADRGSQFRARSS